MPPPSTATASPAWSALLGGVEDVVREPLWRLASDAVTDRLRGFEAVRPRLDGHRLALLR